MRARERFNVTVEGRPDGQPMLFAHGYGCDQTMWRHVAPAFAATHRVVLFDHIGFGGSDASAYDEVRHGSLDGYADDVLDIIDDLDLDDVVFVGHSVSAMIGVLAAARRPDSFADLVLIGPSPRYMDADGYTGGFSAADIHGLLEALDRNFTAWSAQMAPVIMGNPDRPELGEELREVFCRAHPEIARRFAEVLFTADNRADLADVTIRTLVLQCQQDAIAPPEVGAYVHQQLAGSTLVTLEATGHCPNLSAPQETIDAIRAHLDAAPATPVGVGGQP